MATPRRIDPDSFRKLFESMSDEELQRNNERDIAQSEKEHAHFVEHYERGLCYLCGKPFKTISKDTPCVHWLLRQCKFKKSDFPQVCERFGYTQIAAFTRWAANQERFLSGINDLSSEKSGRKVFEYTVRWKNIEWTFDCSKNDYQGHGTGHSAYPHYHLQMRIDGKPFINFGDFHIPLSEEDLFHLDLTHAASDIFHHSFGAGGLGMQAGIEIDPEEIIRETVVTDNGDEATYRLQTMVMAGDKPFSGEALKKMVEESQATGATMASLAHKYLGGTASVKTVVSPADSIPEIARRTERKRR